MSLYLLQRLVLGLRHIAPGKCRLGQTHDRKEAQRNRLPNYVKRIGEQQHHRIGHPLQQNRKRHRPGAGSSYVFSLRPGDVVSAIGPFGDFHVKPTQHEMVYIGGGAGMAPLRAHLAHLLETPRTARKISYWYGARSSQEIFYEEYFRDLAAVHNNFTFHLALSAPLAEDNWTGHTGFIHEVVLENYLRNHPDPAAVEYYLCGPPMMIKACNRTLDLLGVPSQQIAYDEF